MSEQVISVQDVGTDEELTLSQDINGRLFVDDERVWSISALGDGIVALNTGMRTVHIGAADYWRALHGDAAPSLHAAGYLAARLAHVEYHALAVIDALVYEARLTSETHPAIWEQVEELRVALGMSPAHDAVFEHAER